MLHHVAHGSRPGSMCDIRGQEHDVVIFLNVSLITKSRYLS